MKFFVAEVRARTAAELAGANKTTAALFFHRLREVIVCRLDEASPPAGEIEADAGYLGAMIGNRNTP